MIYEAEKGMSFSGAAKKLQDELKWENYKDNSKPTKRTLLFNDLEITVSIDSKIDDLHLIYDLKHQLRRLKK